MASALLNEEVIFKVAYKIASPEARAEYLRQACGDDRVLQDRLAALLQVHDEEVGFLESPPPGLADTLQTPVIAERPGETIGRYKLLEEIGEGGMGVVYLAEQQEPVHRQVAMKIIKPGMDTREVIARFETERQALAMMDHPNIAKVLDGGAAESGRPYFVMELVHGVPLTEYCDQNCLGVRERLELLVQVCQAVQHAHTKGIIHRDLKPSHVIVTSGDGVPVSKIIDFGIAKAVKGQLTEGTAVTVSGQMIGTPLYMSPEQAELGGVDVDTRSDIYSLGVMLYELLTGSTLFDQERVQKAGYDEIRRMIREDEPPRPSTRISTLGKPTPPLSRSGTGAGGEGGPQDTPVSFSAATIAAHRQTEPAKLSRLLRRDLDWIVMKALEKDPARRYQTAGDFARDIERYLADEPIEARPPTLVDRAARWCRRHRALVWSAAVLLALTTITLAVSIVLIAQARHEAVQAYEEEAEQLRATERAEALARKQELLAKGQERLAREQRNLAEAQREEAVKQRDISERNLYIARMRLAQRDWEQGQVGRLREMLDAHIPQRGRADLRGWEWYYYLSLCDSTVTTIRGHKDPVGSVVWSPEGGHLATASADGTVKIWDAATGKEVRTLSGHTQPVNSVDWCPDALSLATASSDGTVKIWDVAAGRVVRTLSGHGKNVESVAWNPDGRRLATGSDDRSVRIWDATSGKPILTWIAHHSAVHKVAWSPDGKRLASRSRDGNGLVKIWDATSAKEVRALSGNGTFVSSFAWSSDGQRMALPRPGRIRICDSETGQELETLARPGDVVYDIAWSPDGRQLALAGFDTLVEIWDAATRRQIRACRGHTDTVTAVAWSPDGASLASASIDRTVKVWDAGKEQGSRTLYGHTGGITSLAWSPDDRRLATASRDSSLKIWDVTSGENSLTLLGHSSIVEGVAWNPDGKRLASCGRDGTVRIWDAVAGKESLTFSGHRQWVNSVAWSPDGRSLASAGHDRSIRIWDPATGRETLSLPGRHGQFLRLAWGPDGKRLAVTGENGTLTVWDVATGKTTLVLPGVGHWHNVAPPAWSLDGRWLAAEVSEGRVIQVWNAADGEMSLRLPGHTGLLSSLAWHPDGCRLVSGEGRGAVKIWDVVAGQELLTFHTQGCADAAWSHDGRRLAATSGNNALIWDASPGYRSGARFGRLKDTMATLERISQVSARSPDGRAELARCWFREGAAWMDTNKSEDERLHGYRDEAAKLLGIGEKPATEKEQPRKQG
jgi:WD40 repeat protein/serine/threonine protein kinase